MDTDKILELSKRITEISEDKISRYEKKVQDANKNEFKKVKGLFPLLLTYYTDSQRYADAIELANKYIGFSGLSYRISNKNDLKRFFNCKANIFKLPIYSSKAEQWDKAVEKLKKAKIG